MPAARASLFRTLGFLAVAGALLGIAACASRPRPVALARPKPAKAAIQPLEPRVDAVLGRRLVMPVALRGAIQQHNQVAARLDDGRQVHAELVWLSILPDTAFTDWLEPAGRWSVTPAGADRLPPGEGVWAAALDLPIDAVGQGVWLNDSRIALNWLPDPGSLGAGDEAWRLPVENAGAHPTLLQLAAPELASPLRRWRFHLLMAGLRPESRPPAELDLREPIPGLGGVVFEDPILEALARQTEARWQVALGNLWLADAELADRLKRRLVAAVDFGDRILAPAWPTSQEDLDALLNDLLDPRVKPQYHAERALAWLEARPAAAAWVIDDAGLRDAQTGRPVAACGIANLTERATLAWASLDDWSGAANLTTVSALSAVRIPVVAPDAAFLPGSEQTRAASRLTLNAGQWQAQRSVFWRQAPASPPGLRIDPLIGDWTMNAWIAGEPDATMLPPSDWATAALLYRAEIAATQESSARSQWMLMVECRTGPMPSPDQETLRIWAGPLGAPTIALKVTASGIILDERAPDQGLRGDFGTARIIRADAPPKWTAHIPIPQRAIEGDGVLRLGIERRDSRGARSAWPRPMLPWQTEPGRLPINTSAWGDLQAARP
jgi:hypothetical protein